MPNIEYVGGKFGGQAIKLNGKTIKFTIENTIETILFYGKQAEEDEFSFYVFLRTGEIYINGEEREAQEIPTVNFDINECTIAGNWIIDELMIVEDIFDEETIREWSQSDTPYYDSMEVEYFGSKVEQLANAYRVRIDTETGRFLGFALMYDEETGVSEFKIQADKFRILAGEDDEDGDAIFQVDTVTNEVQIIGDLIAGKIKSQAYKDNSSQGSYIDLDQNEFRLGGSNNHLEWDGSTLLLRGTMIQSPGGEDVLIPHFRGIYDSGTVYYKGDVVFYTEENSSYIYINDTPDSGIPPTQVSHWSIFSGSGAVAKFLGLYADSQVFRFDEHGEPINPLQKITFAVQKQGVASLINWSSNPSGLLVEGGDSRTISIGCFKDAGINSVSVTVSADGLSDTVTVFKLQDAPSGEKAIVSFLTNESHVIPADADGSNPVLIGASTEMKIYKGLDDFTSGWTFSRINSTGVSSNINSTTGNLSVTGMTADSGTVSITATRSGFPTQVKVFSLAKARRGETGDSGNDAKLLRLHADSQVFHVDVEGDSDPQEIILEVELTNIELDSPNDLVFEVLDGLTEAQVQISAGDQENQRKILFQNMNVNRARIKSTHTPTGLHDITTIVKVYDGEDGEDAFVAILTNEHHTFPADAEGNVGAEDLSDGLTQVVVYKGLGMLPCDSVEESYPVHNGTYRVKNITVSDGLEVDVCLAPNLIMNNLALIGLPGHSDPILAFEVEPTKFNSDYGVVTLEVVAKDNDRFITFVKGITYSKSYAGHDAKLVNLHVDSQVFHVDADGIGDPQEINLEAELINIEDGTVTFTIEEGNATLINVHSLNKKLLFSNMLTDRIRVKAEHSPTGLSDVVTIVKVFDGDDGEDGEDGGDGADAFTVFLTNENHTYPADADGNVLGDWIPGYSQVRVFHGSTALTCDSANSIDPPNTDGHYRITSASASEAGSLSFSRVLVNDNFELRPSDFPASFNSATVTLAITARVNGVLHTFTKIQSYSKSRQGERGEDGQQGAPGAGVVYRGDFAAGNHYYNESIRRDVVKYNNDYYIFKGTSGVQSSWILSNWESFGATFESVATKLLLAEDAVVTKTLTLGENEKSGISGDFSGGNEVAIWAGKEESQNRNEANFVVKESGEVLAEDIKLRGSLDADNVTIGNSSFDYFELWKTGIQPFESSIYDGVIAITKTVRVHAGSSWCFLLSIELQQNGRRRVGARLYRASTVTPVNFATIILDTEDEITDVSGVYHGVGSFSGTLYIFVAKENSSCAIYEAEANLLSGGIGSATFVGTLPSISCSYLDVDWADNFRTKLVVAYDDERVIKRVVYTRNDDSFTVHTASLVLDDLSEANLDGLIQLNLYCYRATSQEIFIGYTSQFDSSVFGDRKYKVNVIDNNTGYSKLYSQEFDVKERFVAMGISYNVNSSYDRSSDVHLISYDLDILRHHCFSFLRSESSFFKLFETNKGRIEGSVRGISIFGGTTMLTDAPFFHKKLAVFGVRGATLSSANRLFASCYDCDLISKDISIREMLNMVSN